ncbi:MAG: hypothetical protein Q4G46_07580 [Propionibacteriaceae bacterium]|nr:hypothetical protein [Propionibacteriaceae bacterium]
MPNVLFLCSGNIGRSAFAERYAQLRAHQLGRDLTFESAGLDALPGAGMEQCLADELTKRGGSPGGFRSRQVDPEMLAETDIVLTMTRRQQLVLITHWPAWHENTFSLGFAAGVARGLTHDVTVHGLADACAATIQTKANQADLPDFYALHPTFTTSTAAQIAGYVDELLSRLV